MQGLGKLWTWLKWPVALGVLGWLFVQNQTRLLEVWQRPKNWSFLALSLALIGGSTLVTFVRWYLLVWAQNFPFRLRDAIRLGFQGLVCNYIAPGSVGGDLIKAVLLAREQSSRRAVAVATVLLDRILGLLALFMVGACATLLPAARSFPQRPELTYATWLLWGGSLCGLLGLGLMLAPGVTRWKLWDKVCTWPYVGKTLGELIHGVGLYQSQRLVVLVSVVLSLVGHAGLITGFYCGALAMREPWIPDLVTHFYFMPNAELFGVLMPVPGGVGALEGAIEWFYKLLAPSSVLPEDARAAGFIAAVTFRVITLLVAAAGGGYYITARKEITAALSEEAALEESKPEQAATDEALSEEGESEDRRPPGTRSPPPVAS